MEILLTLIHVLWKKIYKNNISPATEINLNDNENSLNFESSNNEVSMDIDASQSQEELTASNNNLAQSELESYNVNNLMPNEDNFTCFNYSDSSDITINDYEHITNCDLRSQLLKSWTKYSDINKWKYPFENAISQHKLNKMGNNIMEDINLEYNSNTNLEREYRQINSREFIESPRIKHQSKQPRN